MSAAPGAAGLDRSQAGSDILPPSHIYFEAGPSRRGLVMTLLRQIRVVALTGVVLGFAVTVLAQGTQAPAKPFELQVGQAGKDVVWVSTP